MNVAVYGTLKAGKWNHKFLFKSALVGNGKTEELYPMVVQGLPYLGDFPGAGNRVRVEVYDVDQLTLDRLDLLEGHPQFYQRKEIMVLLDTGDKVTAWCYFISASETFFAGKSLVDNYA